MGRAGRQDYCVNERLGEFEMKQIRSGVFETNSSSTHSLVLRDKSTPLSDSYLTVQDDGYVHVSFGEFGWGYDVLDSQEEKLSYLCTMAAYSDNNMASNEDFYKTPDFMAINEAIQNRCDCNGVIVDTEISKYVGADGASWPNFDGYIDHQSVYTSLQSFLDGYDTTIEEVVFSFGAEIIIDNDNH